MENDAALREVWGVWTAFLSKNDLGFVDGFSLAQVFFWPFYFRFCFLWTTPCLPKIKRGVVSSLYLVWSLWLCVSFPTGLTAALFFAGKGGRRLADANETAMLLREYILKTAPLPPGSVRGVYPKGDFTGRTIVYGYPNSDSGYYVCQELDKNLNLTTTYTSKVILDISSLQDVFAPSDLNDEV